MRKIAVIITLIILTVIPYNIYSADPYICGDANNDSTVNIFDITFIVSYLYRDGVAPDPMEAVDVNNDSTANIFDVTYLITFLYKEGPDPDCPPIVVDTVILPLKIGNLWLTDVVEYNENGQVVDNYTASGTVVGDTIIENHSWYLLESDSGTVDTTVWTNKEDGAGVLTDSAGMPEVLTFKYPASTGENYSISYATVTVESVNASVTVPAGIFNCHYYRFHIPIYGTIGRIWAALNVGLIRAEEYGLTLFGTYLSKKIGLLSYSLS